MASPASSSSSVWFLVLGVCVSLVGGSDCGKECALCMYRLLGQQSTFSSLTCSLECKGGLDSQKLLLCRDLLLDKENSLGLDVEPREQQEQEAVAATDNDGGNSPEHLLTKRYGGFMKRYGGFMSRRASLPEEVLEEPGSLDKEESIRLEILKLLNAATEHGMEGEGQGGEEVKRYGGFMRRGEEAAAHSNLLEAVLGRGLKKRSGGFMRRVGAARVAGGQQQERGGLKRAWESSSEPQKRYGGFMD